MKWISFQTRLPSKHEADEHGFVWALEPGGTSRPVMWNWVHTPALWAANGFTHWKRPESPVQQ